MKSRDVVTSGMTAFLNFPIFASNALRPSKKTTSSPRSSTSFCTSYGFRCLPPPTTPASFTLITEGSPNATSSSFSRATRRGNSFPVPSDHLKSIFLNPGYFLVRATYFLRDSISPPTVPLIPWREMRMRPFIPRDSHSVSCHKRTAAVSSIGVKP